MDQICNAVTDVIQWIRQDHAEWPLRFYLEVAAWAMSVSCAVIMSLTIPDAPFLLLYPIFITQCLIFSWCAWTRQSFGMLANYALLVSIDSVGLARLIFH
jgi:hypothetical protein